MKLNRFCLQTALVLPLLLAGCVRVQPWDRDALADASMKPDRDPTTVALREHMYFSREAANGGQSVGGGGCGCN